MYLLLYLPTVLLVFAAYPPFKRNDIQQQHKLMSPVAINRFCLVVLEKPRPGPPRPVKDRFSLQRVQEEGPKTNKASADDEFLRGEPQDKTGIVSTVTFASCY